MNCGVVVTYQPRLEYLHNIVELAKQFDEVIVVDNGSGVAEIAALRGVCSYLNLILIENDSNLGIGVALNIGIKRALDRGAQWIGLFDQDSRVTEGFLTNMIKDFLRFAVEHPIAQIVPRYRDPETGREAIPSRYSDGGLFLTITSGSLFPRGVFEELGLFREELFIYCVDDEYSLRLRKERRYIGRSINAVLLHRSGHPSYKRFLGFRFEAKNYRPESRYYYARNKVWILRHYGLRFPRLIFPTLREFVTIPFKLVLAEANAIDKVSMFFRGIRDGVAGRTGKLFHSA